MECNKVKELLSMYIDDLLDNKEKEDLRVHLENCSQCQQELKSLQDLLGLLGEMDEIAPPEDFRKQIIDKLQGTLPESIKDNNKLNIKLKLRKFTSSKLAKISTLAAALLLIAGISYTMQIKSYSIQYLQDTPMEGNVSNETAVANAPMVNAGSRDGVVKTKAIDKNLYSGKQELTSSAKPERGSNSSVNYDMARKVIKNGSMDLETKEFDKTVSSIDKILQKVQGYYENKNINSEGETKNGTFTLRIPSQKFLDVSAQIEKLGKVNNKSVTGDDVTTEYYDTKARIKVLKQQEERLLVILKKAKDVDEILRVENELRRIREEIEINEGRMKVLDNSIGMSTLNLQITEVKEITHITPPGVKGTILRAWQAFISSVNAIIKLIENLIIFLGGALPYLTILALGSIAYIYYRKRKA